MYSMIMKKTEKREPNNMNYQDIKTLGELKKSGYKSKSIKEELRDNLIKSIKERKNPFEGIYGYDDTVIPDVERAILAQHNILLLGLRGQAKTRIARLMVNLLDEYIPFISGSEICDDPFKPISIYARNIIEELGDETPISWQHRDGRYTEKLATPDVTVADLIGDVDPIKAAALKMAYSDERVLHYGLIPRSHRGIFVINELPDLQPRIQVSLFNILQEGDIQIRGFKLRLPLDIQFFFTANPEDYTNRGSIVTPLKDRIESQILTHYPKTADIGMSITKNESNIHQTQSAQIKMSHLAEELVEQVAIEARNSEYVDSKSGVSARLTISAFESLYASAERRLLINGETSTMIRISDFWGILPAITGKIELVYEGEQEGPANVSKLLLGKAIRTVFKKYFPDPEIGKKKKKGAESIPNDYEVIASYFGQGNSVDIIHDLSQKEYEKLLWAIPGLKDCVNKNVKGLTKEEGFLFMEFLLHGLSEYSLISRNTLERGLGFGDLLSSYMSLDFENEN